MSNFKIKPTVQCINIFTFCNLKWLSEMIIRYQESCNSISKSFNIFAFLKMTFNSGIFDEFIFSIQCTTSKLLKNENDHIVTRRLVKIISLRSDELHS